MVEDQTRLHDEPAHKLENTIEKRAEENRTMIDATALSTLVVAASVLTAAAAGPLHGRDSDTGRPGKPSDVDDVKRIEMEEKSSATAGIAVDAGETVRLVVISTGEILHEFSIGTDATHNADAREMHKMMRIGMMTARESDKTRAAGMMHDDPDSLMLGPGMAGEVGLTFSGLGDAQPACDIPGHRADGMSEGIEAGGVQFGQCAPVTGEPCPRPDRICAMKRAKSPASPMIGAKAISIAGCRATRHRA